MFDRDPVGVEGVPVVVEVDGSEAEDCLEAGLGDYDYNMDPEDAALDELSYWGDG